MPPHRARARARARTRARASPRPRPTRRSARPRPAPARPATICASPCPRPSPSTRRSPPASPRPASWSRSSGGLLSLDQDLQLIPDLAEALPELTQNDDGTVTYTFHLRRDALFHNGRRVQADDVKWSIERHAAPETFSPVAPDFLNDIVGAVDYMRGRADEISGIEVIDDNTIQITIDSPKPYFLFKLTYPTSFVVDRQQVENDPRNWASSPQRHRPLQAGRVEPGRRPHPRALGPLPPRARAR